MGVVTADGDPTLLPRTGNGNFVTHRAVSAGVGRGRESAERYTFVAQAWRHADAQLQAMVTEARASLPP